MEYITPEEVADNVVRELLGFPTGRDVVAALDASTSGPTYRAGVLRQVALERMEELERRHGGAAVAYEMLGPPRLSKLLFEGAILGRLFRDLAEAAALDPDRTAEAARALIETDDDLRVHALSIGIPVLLPDGDRLLRGAQVRVVPERGQSHADPRLADAGWIDLRPANWARWRERCSAMLRRDPGGRRAGPRLAQRRGARPAPPRASARAPCGLGVPHRGRGQAGPPVGANAAAAPAPWRIPRWPSSVPTGGIAPDHYGGRTRAWNRPLLRLARRPAASSRNGSRKSCASASSGRTR